MRGKYITSTPTRRGEELSKILDCDYHYFDLSKYKLVELIIELRVAIKTSSYLHVELVNNMKFFIILRVLQFLSNKSIIYDCHMVVFSYKEVGLLRIIIYKIMLIKQKIVFHNNTIAKDQCITKNYMVLYTPLKSKRSFKSNNEYTIGILSNSYSDIADDLIEKIIKTNLTIYMSGHVPEKFVRHQNVYAPGRIDEDHYIKTALNCQVIFGLSDRDDCLVLVGREFLVFGKPIIVSDTRANREHYGSYVTYLSNHDDVATINNKVSKALNNEYAGEKYQIEYQKVFLKQCEEYSDFIL